MIQKKTLTVSIHDNWNWPKQKGDYYFICIKEVSMHDMKRLPAAVRLGLEPDQMNSNLIMNK